MLGSILFTMSRCGVHLIVARVGLEDFDPRLKRYRF
jgi:hypothetical protein